MGRFQKPEAILEKLRELKSAEFGHNIDKNLLIQPIKTNFVIIR